MQALARRHAPRSRDPASTLPGSAPAPRRRHGRTARRRKPGPLASGAAHARHAAMSRHGGDGRRVARCARSQYAASANGKRGSVGKRSAQTAGAYKSTTKWCRSRADAPAPPQPPSCRACRAQFRVFASALVPCVPPSLPPSRPLGRHLAAGGHVPEPQQAPLRSRHPSACRQAAAAAAAAAYDSRFVGGGDGGVAIVVVVKGSADIFAIFGGGGGDGGSGGGK